METAVGSHPFAHQSEAEFAEILDYYGIRWEYESTAFPLAHHTDGRVAARFAPDFYLPDVDLWVEITTIRQSLMRQKRKKLRRFAALYPDFRIKLLGASDIKALMWKYRRSASGVVGPAGSRTPARTRRAREREAAA